MKKILSVLLILSFQTSFACLNGDSYLLKNKKYLYMDYESNIPQGHEFFTSEYDDYIRELDSLYQVKQNLDFLSDKGLILILQEKYQEAINLYLTIEKMKPNRYSTASNIGTAYELIGDNENALKWIKKAVEINPESHFRSEWIHVAILEAKIKGDAWINADSLIKMNFGTERKPHSNLSQEELTALSHALYYQLKERMSFIAPKDPIVAQLLFELGNVYYLKGQFKDALGTYQQAKKYGFQSQLMDQRISSLNWKSKMVTKFILWPYVVGGIISLILVGFFLYRRRMKNLANIS
jgi:tetratricopeptide (TPR) repeat protein